MRCFFLRLTVIPILVYQVLLADKLDGDLKSLPFTIVSIPLFMGLFALILLSFNSKGGNKWWFGIRKSFSQFLLSSLPCLQGNQLLARNYKNYHNVSCRNPARFSIAQSNSDWAPEKVEILSILENISLDCDTAQHICPMKVINTID